MAFAKAGTSKRQRDSRILNGGLFPSDTRLTKAQIRDQNRKMIESRLANGS